MRSFEAVGIGDPSKLADYFQCGIFVCFIDVYGFDHRSDNFGINGPFDRASVPG